MQNSNIRPPHLKGHFLKNRCKTDSHRPSDFIQSKNNLFDGMIKIRSIGFDEIQFSPLNRGWASKSPCFYAQQGQHLKRNKFAQKLQNQLHKLNKSNINFGRSAYEPVRVSKSLNLNLDVTISKQLQPRKPYYRCSPKIINVRLAERLLLAKMSKEIDNKRQQKQPNEQIPHRIHDSYTKIMRRLHQKK